MFIETPSSYSFPSPPKNISKEKSLDCSEDQLFVTLLKASLAASITSSSSNSQHGKSKISKNLCNFLTKFPRVAVEIGKNFSTESGKAYKNVNNFSQICGRYLQGPLETLVPFFKNEHVNKGIIFENTQYYDCLLF